MSDTQQNQQEAGAGPATDFDAVIVGAGFSGLYALHKLRDEMGIIPADVMASAAPPRAELPLAQEAAQ